MVAIVSKMRALKGRGVGKDGVMGKLKMVDSRESSFDTNIEWSSDFSRAQGIAISRIEEAYEELSKKEGISHIANTLEKMLEALRDRALISSINEITELGISLYDAISHIELEAEENTVNREVCLLLRRVLRGKSGIELGDGDGYIGVICEPLDITEALSLKECEFLGLLSTQSAESFFAAACDSFGISAIFLGEEVPCSIISGESAILYPERNIIYLSPRIDIVDDFTATMKSEAKGSSLKGIFKCLLGEQIYNVSEYGGEKCLGIAVDMETDERSEEEIFELCRSVAEISNRDIFILLRNAHGGREYLRGILRAAVYGRISVLPSFSSTSEYAAFCELLSEVKNELKIENREFDSDICRGIVIDSIFSLLLSDKIVHDTRLIFVDIESFAKDFEKKDQKDMVISVIKLLLDKFLDRDLSLFAMSNFDILEQIDAEDIESCNLPLSKLFWVEKI